MRGLYFAFHYTRDIWRVNQVRNSGIIEGPKSVGFADRSLWEEAKTKGQRALESLIVEGMKNTSVTVVLIGKETASRPWVEFEIEESIRRKNALIGVRIHHLKDQRGRADRSGPVPALLRKRKSPIHKWTGDASELGEWAESAYRKQLNPSVFDRIDAFFGW